MKEMMRYSQGLAAQDYGAAHGRYMDEQRQDLLGYATQLPYQWQSYEQQTMEPWKQYAANVGQGQETWGRLGNLIGYSPGASPQSPGMGDAYSNYSNALMTQGLQGQQTAGGIANILSLLFA